MRSYKQFVLRSLRFFQRNFAAGVLPFLMPLIFLFLFLSSSNGTSQAPTLTLEQLGDPHSSSQTTALDHLQRTGLIRIVASSAQVRQSIYDGRLSFPATPGAGIDVLLKPGYQHWGDLIRQEVSGMPTGLGTSPLTVHFGKVARATYLEFIIPGLFVMALIQLSTAATAGVVLNDRADGTLRMIASARYALIPYFTAELTTRLAFAALSYAVMATLVSVLAHFTPANGWVEFTLVYILGAAMMISVGVLLGGVLPNRRSWGGLITLASLAMWFFSDILFEASQHPYARPIALLMPSTYLTDSLRRVSTAEAGSFGSAQDLLAMALILVLAGVLTVRFFKFDTRD